MKVIHQYLDDVCLVRCTGRIVAGHDDELRTTVSDATMVDAVSVIVLDLTETTVLDAAGLGTLAEMHALATGFGKRLKLMNVPPRVARVLQMTGLAGVLESCSVQEMFAVMCQAKRAAAARSAA